MTVTITHAFQSSKADGSDTSLIQPSYWNASHVIVLGTAKLVGRTTAATGAAEEIGISSDLTLASGVLGIAATVATLAGTQTLTNKTLTSPTLTSPTLNTPTLNTPRLATATFTGITTFPSASIDASGNGSFVAVSDALGNLRTVPLSAQASYTLVTADSGKCINLSSGGLTVPAGSGLAPGQSVTVYNNSNASQTITATAVTMYWVGTATTGNRTLSQRGLCTIFCVATNTFVITGGGLT